jgi:hypothetical protein
MYTADGQAIQVNPSHSLTALLLTGLSQGLIQRLNKAFQVSRPEERCSLQMAATQEQTTEI